MVNAFRALEERGLVEWCSHPEDLDAFLTREKGLQRI